MTSTLSPAYRRTRKVTEADYAWCLDCEAFLTSPY